ncbi:DoxX family protein [Pseudorhodoplanes sinuspersici]|uniref:DoxX family protein n=1 Tax=Pseudorhodoplanes sinuspersici TaxID=1235591 RepID=A0A1W6ZQC0_9HYPH|nr:DoxX family protein [Pseudorhodoplanes sinuspersici]ARP99593.1 DoxX family protein [Pseudorhodoplanes sinuspersici]RKE70565.1 putative membrane protein YphA (DoxX/SURF4 family) [Pseudorhodoplanes sinuspersici]
MPEFIARLLDQSWFAILARIVLTFAFWGSGLAKLINFQEGVAEMAMFNLPNPVMMNILTIITQLGGSLLIIINRWTWLGAGALAVFTALTIPLVHKFWALPAPDSIKAFHVATEHVTVIGGLMIVSILSRYTGGAGNGPKRD